MTECHDLFVEMDTRRKIEDDVGCGTLPMSRNCCYWLQGRSPESETARHCYEVYDISVPSSYSRITTDEIMHKRMRL
jgi:hypothetical protein